ncbi:MAG: formate dehydrogenase subunit gamma [Telluria sp.]
MRIVNAIWLVLLLAAAGLAAAEVPDKKATPAYPEEQTILQTEQGTPEHGYTDPRSGRTHLDRHYLGEYGSTEGTVIVQRGGNTWRTLRNGPGATISGTLILVAPLLLFGMYVAVGPARMEHPPTGRRVLRFDAWDRIVHWSTALSFLTLALTGLIILFGKKLLIPLLGHDIFAGLAIVCKYLHNFVGPLFVACSVIMIATFIRRNFFSQADWYWLRKLGGLTSKEHIPAPYFNAGEKLWFWLGVCALGLVMSVSGLVLDFVDFGQTRYVLQWADYFHLAGATFYIAAAMGHIFLGTVGTPGAYEGMRHGYVDEEWARSHHRLWYEQVKDAPPPEAPPRGVRGGRP